MKKFLACTLAASLCMVMQSAFFSSKAFAEDILTDMSVYTVADYENPPTMGGSENPPTMGGGENSLTMGGGENPPTMGGSENPPTMGGSENPPTMGSNENPDTGAESSEVGKRTVFLTAELLALITLSAGIAAAKKSEKKNDN